MRLRLLRKALLVAAVAFVTPVWADGGHGHGPGHGHGGPHHGWNDHRPHFDGRHPHYAYGWRRPYPVYYGPRYYGYYNPGYYYAPYPAYAPYGYAVARPGIQIVVPNIYIPLR